MRGNDTRRCGSADADSSAGEMPENGVRRRGSAEVGGQSRLILSNPDMLHVTMLPGHRDFSRFLSNLRSPFCPLCLYLLLPTGFNVTHSTFPPLVFSLPRSPHRFPHLSTPLSTSLHTVFHISPSFVVVDEAHAYRGAFGCHAALIFRRLCRLCAHVYGSDPIFIVCSATRADPKDHVRALLGGEEVTVVDGSDDMWLQELCALEPAHHRAVCKPFAHQWGSSSTIHSSSHHPLLLRCPSRFLARFSHQ
ncbi:unnamed protein product [Closterium sp. NIES-64]|nr:unnamed protein product [Closterium sp. NIES-64]